MTRNPPDGEVADLLRLARRAIRLCHAIAGALPERLHVPPDIQGIGRLSWQMISRFLLQRGIGHLVAVSELTKRTGEACAVQLDVLCRTIVEDNVTLFAVLEGSDQAARESRCAAFQAWGALRQQQFLKKVLAGIQRERSAGHPEVFLSQWGFSPSELNALMRKRRKGLDSVRRYRDSLVDHAVPESGKEWDGREITDRALTAIKRIRREGGGIESPDALFGFVTVLYPFLSNEVHGNGLALERAFDVRSDGAIWSKRSERPDGPLHIALLHVVALMRCIVRQHSLRQYHRRVEGILGAMGSLTAKGSPSAPRESTPARRGHEPRRSSRTPSST